MVRFEKKGLNVVSLNLSMHGLLHLCLTCVHNKQTRIFSAFHLFLAGRNTLSLTVPVCCSPRMINQMIALAINCTCNVCATCVYFKDAGNMINRVIKQILFSQCPHGDTDLTHDNHHAWANLVHQWSCYCRCLNFYWARSFTINITQLVQLQCCLHNRAIHHGFGSRR